MRSKETGLFTPLKRGEQAHNSIDLFGSFTNRVNPRFSQDQALARAEKREDDRKTFKFGLGR